MHELSICQSIIHQGIEIARKHNASSITRINLSIGPLAGIDTHLLEAAFPIAARTSPAEHAILDIQVIPIQIHCSDCDINSEVPMNNLTCPQCNNKQTRLISGDEMIITHIELTSNQESIHV